MKFKLDPIEVQPEDPFKYDALEREEAVKALANLIDDLEGPFVLALNSPWGTGKTPLVRTLKAHLELQDQKGLYFNAWETDFSTDPLISFLGELEESVLKKGDDENDFRDEFDKVKKIATVIAKNALPIVTQMAAKKLENMGVFTAEELRDITDTTTDDYVSAYRVEQALNTRFRDALKEAVKQLTNSDGDENLIVFIDELDRCRPTYAIELLERMKHFFNTKNIIFVLALDMQQLGVSLGVVYGDDIKDKEYLRRFIDLEYLLPKPDAEKFTDNLFERFEFGEFFSKRTHRDLVYDEKNLRETFNQLFNIFDLSLRAREQCFTRLRVLMSVTDETQYIYPELLVMLIVLKEVNPDLYEEYAFKGSSAMVILNFLNKTIPGANFLTTDEGILLETMLITAECYPNFDSAAIAGYKGTAEDPSANEVDKKRAQRIMEYIRWMVNMRASPSLNHILQKIEIVTNLK